MWSWRVNGSTTSSLERVSNGTGHTKEIAEKLLPFQGRRVSIVCCAIDLASFACQALTGAEDGDASNEGQCCCKRQQSHNRWRACDRENCANFSNQPGRIAMGKIVPAMR